MLPSPALILLFALSPLPIFLLLLRFFLIPFISQETVNPVPTTTTTTTSSSSSLPYPPSPALATILPSSYRSILIKSLIGRRDPHPSPHAVFFIFAAVFPGSRIKTIGSARDLQLERVVSSHTFPPSLVVLRPLRPQDDRQSP